MNVHVHFKQGRDLLRINKMTLDQLIYWMVGKYDTTKVLVTKHRLECGETVRINMPNNKAHILVKPLAKQ